VLHSAQIYLRLLGASRDDFSNLIELLGVSEMVEAQLFQKIETLQVQLANLQTQIYSGRPTKHKDLSVVSLIPKCARTDKYASVHEFFRLSKTLPKLEIGDQRTKYKLWY